MARRWKLAVDCADADRLAAFWAATLRYEVMAPPDGHASWADYSRTVATRPGEAWSRIADPDGLHPPLLFHSVPEAKAVKNRLHLDVRAPAEPPGERRRQIDAEVERVVGLGGKVVQPVTDEAGYFVVMRDPEGNEFCID
jgi:hypothetical protein